MRIEIVNPAEWIPRIGDLLASNWAETGFDFAFDPDVQAYQRLHDAGAAFALACFDGSEVVGYCTVCVVPHPHNKTVLFGSNDALFVLPEYRGGTAPGRLIKAAEAEAKRRGAQLFAWHTRAGTPLAEVLQRHGYQPIDVTVGKRI